MGIYYGQYNILRDPVPSLDGPSVELSVQSQFPAPLCLRVMCLTEANDGAVVVIVIVVGHGGSLYNGIANQ